MGIVGVGARVGGWARAVAVARGAADWALGVLTVVKLLCTRLNLDRERRAAACAPGRLDYKICFLDLLCYILRYVYSVDGPKRSPKRKSS